MAECPSCGKKVSFLSNKGTECGECGKSICGSCAKYVTEEKGKGSLTEKVPKGPSKRALCSDDCAKKSYKAFEEAIVSGTFVVLTNKNNDKFILEEKKDADKDFRARIFTIPNAPDGRTRPAGDLIPELVPIHDWMREDLEKKEHNLVVNYIKIT